MEFYCASIFQRNWFKVSKLKFDVWSWKFFSWLVLISRDSLSGSYCDCWLSKVRVSDIFYWYFRSIQRITLPLSGDGSSFTTVMIFCFKRSCSSILSRILRESFWFCWFLEDVWVTILSDILLKWLYNNTYAGKSQNWISHKTTWTLHPFCASTDDCQITIRTHTRLLHAPL